MTILAFIIGLVPSLAWLIFYLKQDPHPEPKKVIFFVFLGGAISTFIALAAQLLLNRWALIQDFKHYTLVYFFLLAGIEELFKFGATYLIICKYRKEFNEPIDAMIYMVVAALGFAAVENIATAFRTDISAFETVALRFIGATLLHTLSSGLLGYHWALSLIRKKWQFLLVGFLVATILHTIFNFLIIKFEPVIIPTAFLIIYAFFILYDFEKLRRIS